MHLKASCIKSFRSASTSVKGVQQLYVLINSTSLHYPLIISEMWLSFSVAVFILIESCGSEFYVRLSLVIFPPIGLKSSFEMHALVFFGKLMPYVDTRSGI